jgi:hypothetical protein
MYMNKLSLRTMISAGLTILIFSGCAVHHVSTAPKVLEQLNVPNDQKLAFMLRGVGVQVYACKALNNDPTRFDWEFVAPRADLFDDQANKLGKHYAGPTWEANDGSKVVGEVLAKDNGPDPTAIPWLLLRAKEHAGMGIFSKIASVQRLNTKGGKAPASGCTQAKVGTEVRIPYTADYYFYGAGY